MLRTGPFSSLIGRLTLLTTLLMENVYLTGTIPESLWSLANLNIMTVVAPGIVGNLLSVRFSWFL
jgi:hypothetical protein